MSAAQTGTVIASSAAVPDLIREAIPMTARTIMGIASPRLREGRNDSGPYG